MKGSRGRGSAAEVVSRCIARLPASPRAPFEPRLDLVAALERGLALQARLDAGLARHAPADRLPALWRARLLQGAALVVALALGLAVGSTLAWAVLAVPMTAVVTVALASAPARRPRVVALDPTSGITVRRRAPAGGAHAADELPPTAAYVIE